MNFAMTTSKASETPLAISRDDTARLHWGATISYLNDGIHRTRLVSTAACGNLVSFLESNSRNFVEIGDRMQ